MVTKGSSHSGTLGFREHLRPPSAMGDAAPAAFGTHLQVILTRCRLRHLALGEDDPQVQCHTFAPGGHGVRRTRTNHSRTPEPKIKASDVTPLPWEMGDCSHAMLRPQSSSMKVGQGRFRRCHVGHPWLLYLLVSWAWVRAWAADVAGAPTADAALSPVSAPGRPGLVIWHSQPVRPGQTVLLYLSLIHI